jgi:lysozyme family protein
MASFDRCIAFTLQAEGGWLEDPLDPERCTHMGITLEGWSVNLGRKCTLAELRAMTRG